MTTERRSYDFDPYPWYRIPEGKKEKRFVLKRKYNGKDDLNVALSAKMLEDGVAYRTQSLPAGIWNVYTDSSIIGKGAGGFSGISPKHNAFVQVNLGRLLDLLVFDDDLSRPMQ